MFSLFRNINVESVYYLGLKPSSAFFYELEKLKKDLKPEVGENHLTIAFDRSIPLIGFPLLQKDERALRLRCKHKFTKLSANVRCKLTGLFIDELTGSYGYELEFESSIERLISGANKMLIDKFEIHNSQIMARNCRRLVLAKNLPYNLLRQVAKEHQIEAKEFIIKGVILSRKAINAQNKFKTIEKFSLA
ncbi:MAG: hypothetical protein JXQ87_04010 [Bacteroidia bacterium]